MFLMCCKSETSGGSTHLEAGEFEEVVLLRDVQQMVLDVGVHYGQDAPVTHGAGKVPEGDGVLGFHLGYQVVSTDLRVVEACA